MLSKRLVGTIGVLTATVLTSPVVADASPSPGSVGEPPNGHLVQGSDGLAHGCPNCPHPPPSEDRTHGIEVDPSALDRSRGAGDESGARS
jgi:hypothetical protein